MVRFTDNPLDNPLEVASLLVASTIVFKALERLERGMNVSVKILISVKSFFLCRKVIRDCAGLAGTSIQLHG